MSTADAFLSFKRAKFKTRLPQGLLYTPGHMWLRRRPDALDPGDPDSSESSADRDLLDPAQRHGIWEVGLTRFALRMLGEPVEVDFEMKPDADVIVGRAVGWLEGFKAVTDLYAPLAGRFDGGNPVLDTDLGCVRTSAYDRGWLFAIEGEPGEDAVDAEGYASFLNVTIDKMLGEES